MLSLRVKLADKLEELINQLAAAGSVVRGP
jgi:hypothetical protein